MSNYLKGRLNQLREFLAGEKQLPDGERSDLYIQDLNDSIERCEKELAYYNSGSTVLVEGFK